MVRNAKVVSLTVEEGNILLRVASKFACPEKIGDKAFTPSERVTANAQVAKLYSELKAHSELLLSKGRWYAFGPEKCWAPFRDASNRKQWDLTDPEHEVSVTLDPDRVDGVVYLLLALVHPQSPVCAPAGEQHDFLWPIARKVGREYLLREEVGLPVQEPLKSRWAGRRTDDDYRREAEETLAKDTLNQEEGK